MARNLIGTGADQVSVNGMLGELAFQSKENVNFTGGTGKLSKLDIEAISAQLGVTAVDVFVYDTSKDSDGGAWRKRCQSLSWYNEELNTSYRGSRREFPSVAVIVIAGGTVVLYDGDSPDLPMWMIFPEIVPENGGSATCVSMRNALLFFGSSIGLRSWNFLKDQRIAYNSVVNYSAYQTNVALRYMPGNTGATVPGLSSIVNTTINDVAMTVLPNAPIDAATGLPIPTIVVGTQGGISVIKHDSTVVNMSSSPTTGVSFDRAYNVLSNTNDVNSTFATYSTAIGLATVTNGRGYYYGASGSITVPATMGAVSTPYSNFVIAARDGEIVVPSSSNAGYGKTGLNIIAENYTSKANGMVDYITSKYNSGWMIGDIKGAWLSDTTQETIAGVELLTNGAFTSNISGWSNYAPTRGTVAYSAGKLRIDHTTGTGDVYVRSNFTSPIAAGTRVCFTGRATRVSGTNTLDEVKIYFIRTNEAGIVDLTTTKLTTINDGYFSCYMTCSYDSMGFILGTNAYSGIVVDLDDMSCRTVDADRSANNKGLQIFGSIAKTPVATGADLVAYSGFSSGNYLMQPYNSALNIGTGEYSVAFWTKAQSGGGGGIISRGPADNDEMCRIRLDGSTYGIYFDYGIGGQYCYLANSADRSSMTDGNWKFVVCHVKAGGTPSIYVNGVKMSLNSGIGAAPTTFTTSSSYITYIGCEYGSSSYFSGSIALVRFSATAPSADQIARMYNDEKVLFQDNAKATLYGTSDAVTALAYDEDTQLLHVGTSSGRSVFQGLRRIDNTTTAVSAAISASNGLVAEQ